MTKAKAGTAAAQASAKSASHPLATAPDHLWYRIHVLIYDLRNFKDNEASEARLSCVFDRHYIGAPYFSDEQTKLVKATLVDGKDLVSHIEAVMSEKLGRQKRVSESDYRPCAAHDISPILDKAFGVNAKLLGKNKQFLKVVKKSGLELKEGEEWKGV